jgi:hypothetical protein
MKIRPLFIGQLTLFITVAFVLVGAVQKTYHVAWGTGAWWGKFSLGWGLGFAVFFLFCLFLLVIVGLFLWNQKKFQEIDNRLAKLRNRIGSVRWLLIATVSILPAWSLQYSAWGVVFDDIQIRLLIWFISCLCLGTLLTRDKAFAWNWSGVLAAFIISSTGFMLAHSLKNVTDYPFTLGWSEGNRMWDYSLLFGSDLYEYSPDHPPVAYLDPGRQLSGGLPFLFGEVTILQERLWLGMMTIIPYVVLGWIAFYVPRSGSKMTTFLAGLWVWMFLNQGPIHAPLLWCAVLVGFAWGRPLWLAVPLVILSGYLAQSSRYTWVFAPAMWAGMLEFGSGAFVKISRSARILWRTSSVVLSGLAGGILVPNYIGICNWILNFFDRSCLQSNSAPITLSGMSFSTLTTKVADQPLLWYRLFPNATYGNGILLGLLIAIAPLIIVLVYLLVNRNWLLNIWQKFVILLPLLAFLVVGLIISTKIGGGGDLHNMDMFLIGIMFAAALAWRSGGVEWIGLSGRSQQWIRVVLILMIVVPTYKPLMNLRPVAFANDAKWVAVLADVSTPAVPPAQQSEELIRVLGSLPSEELTYSTLELIRSYVQEAKMRGDVLFMDQRQLLTFGYIQNVALVWEYEKKLMMDQALNGNMDYFIPFYNDLAAKRFSLIISDPLRTPIKDSGYQFGEENNAWVKWVALPVLCYYEPVKTIKYVRVQLLIPSEANLNCPEILP